MSIGKWVESLRGGDGETYRDYYINGVGFVLAEVNLYDPIVGIWFITFTGLHGDYKFLGDREEVHKIAEEMLPEVLLIQNAGNSEQSDLMTAELLSRYFSA